MIDSVNAVLAILCVFALGLAMDAPEQIKKRRKKP